MNLLELLTRDHRHMTELFEKLLEEEDGKSGSQRESFTELESLFSAHTEAEETVLYARLKDQVPASTAVLEAYEEHAFAKELFSELSRLSSSSAAFKSKLKVLKDAIDRHVRMEEGRLFEEARATFTTQDMTAFGEDFIERKENYLEMRPAAEAASKRGRHLSDDEPVPHEADEESTELSEENEMTDDRRPADSRRPASHARARKKPHAARGAGHMHKR